MKTTKFYLAIMVIALLMVISITIPSAWAQTKEAPAPPEPTKIEYTAPAPGGPGGTGEKVPDVEKEETKTSPSATSTTAPAPAVTPSVAPATSAPPPVSSSLTNKDVEAAAKNPAPAELWYHGKKVTPTKEEWGSYGVDSEKIDAHLAAKRAAGGDQLVVDDTYKITDNNRDALRRHEKRLTSLEELFSGMKGKTAGKDKVITSTKVIAGFTEDKVAREKADAAQKTANEVKETIGGFMTAMETKIGERTDAIKKNIEAGMKAMKEAVDKIPSIETRLISVETTLGDLVTKVGGLETQIRTLGKRVSGISYVAWIALILAIPGFIAFLMMLAHAKVHAGGGQPAANRPRPAGRQAQRGVNPDDGAPNPLQPQGAI